MPGHGELVLIVEDEPEFRELVELWVSRHGWRTATAADGLEVMRRFEEEAPDLVLLDLNLPGMDGWEVTEWIRRVSTRPDPDGHGHGRRGRRRPRPRQPAPTTTSPSPSGCPSSSPGSPRRFAASRLAGGRPADGRADRAPDGLRIEPVTHRVSGDGGRGPPHAHGVPPAASRSPAGRDALRGPRGAAARRLGTHLRRGDTAPPGHDAQPAGEAGRRRRPAGRSSSPSTGWATASSRR